MKIGFKGSTIFIHINLSNAVLGKVMQRVLGEFYYRNQFVFSFINIFFAFLIYDKKAFKKWYLLIIVSTINILLLERASFNPAIFKNYVILLLALILRFLISGYNYEKIPTNEVKKGMILSYSTVMKFSVSKVKGLPRTTTEDISSKITQEEADSIRRWGKSAKGEETIIVVRKIPFAIFIIVGEISFFLVRILK